MRRNVQAVSACILGAFSLSFGKVEEKPRAGNSKVPALKAVLSLSPLFIDLWSS